MERRNFLKASGVAGIPFYQNRNTEGECGGESKNQQGGNGRYATEIRDDLENLDEYRPKKNAKFFALDTGQVFIGTGQEWVEVETTGEEPRFESVTTTELNGINYAPTSTDIQAEIDAAAGGGTVQLSPGVYTISEPLVMRQGVRLVGAGNQATILRLSNGTNDDVIQIPANELECEISNLYIDGNKANNTSGFGIRITGYNWRPKLFNLIIRDTAGAGIQFEGGTDKLYEPILQNIDQGFANSHGLNTNVCYDLSLYNCYFHENAAQGMRVQGSGHVCQHLHTFDNTNGLLVDGANDCWFYGTFLDTNTRNGALLRNATRIFFEGSYAFNNSTANAGTYDGIQLTNSQDNYIFFSTFADNQGSSTQRHGYSEANGSKVNNIAFCTGYGNVQELIGNRDPSTIPFRVNGYNTQTFASTTFSGDGATKTFTISSHQLAENPWRQNILAWASPVNDAAKEAGPISISPADLNGDYAYEALEVRFSSPPPQGTDNVEISWSARLI
ncbi:glycosyl hydrolase family 28-related protein [Haladaptatus caseinilyticus]|uniref:glycosyl hydrolase family 28-related protein n=1 Tax=Haladaptatus caseinilyticus TaxID=2993314 RepID=UPI00224B8155|nr:right-handed parallel beta-helix repeat-containing protein [Haladaptatus caseinilyticus]